MKLVRQFFFIFIAAGLTATTCLKQNGAQINSYTLSRCPPESYTLPVFGESEDYLVTQDKKSNFSCADYQAYTIMKKEGLDTEARNFLLKLNRENSVCKVQVMIRGLCAYNSPECKSAPYPQTPALSGVSALIPEFLFRDLDIKVTDANEVTRLTEADFKKTCGIHE